MAVGARDRIDKLLVDKYIDTQVDNHDNTPSMVDPDKMYEAMDDFAKMHLAMINLQKKLSHACSQYNAKAAKYRQSVT